MQYALDALKVKEQKFLAVEASFNKLVAERDAAINEYNEKKGTDVAKALLDQVKDACKKVDKALAQYGNANAKWCSERKAFLSELLGRNYD